MPTGFPRSLYAGNPGAYAPALLLQYLAYACRLWTTLNKLPYAPLRYPRIGTLESAPIFTYLIKYASGCYLRHRWFPRRTLSGNLVNTLLGCRLRVDQEALTDTGMGPFLLADPIHESTGEVFLRRGVLKRTCVDRLGARISVQLLDHLTCLLIATPQVARCRARFANPVVGHSEVGVERLSRRTGCASTSRIRRSTRSPLEDSRPADSSRR